MLFKNDMILLLCCSNVLPVEAGSGGGACSHGYGASGGSAVRLVNTFALVDGLVTMNGNYSKGGGGGGAGGSIWLDSMVGRCHILFACHLSTYCMGASFQAYARNSGFFFHDLLLNYIANWFKITVFRFFKMLNLHP